MKRWLFFAYGVSCHVLFFATFAYLMAFVGNLFVPKSIDSPTSTPLPVALLVDTLLIVMFGLQHSVMARPAFKRMWTKIVPQPIERSTYVLVSNIVTAVLIWQWRGVDVVIWDVENPMGRGLMWGLFVAGWLLVPAVSLMISHFDLFGTRQVWLYLRKRDYTHLPFRTPMAYQYVRHPLYVGWATAFWATPTMTLGHLLFAGLMTTYMALASIVEERDLIAHFGRIYEDYRRNVPAFMPRMPWRVPAKGAERRVAV